MVHANGLTALNAADFWNELTKSNVSFAANIDFDNKIMVKGTTNSGMSGGAIQPGAIHTLGGISAKENIVAGSSLYCSANVISNGNITATSGTGIISGKKLSAENEITCTNGAIQSNGVNGTISGTTVKSGNATLKDGVVAGTTMKISGNTTLVTLSTNGLLTAHGGITSADIKVPNHTVTAKKVTADDVCGNNVASGNASLKNGAVKGTTLTATSSLDVTNCLTATNRKLTVTGEVAATTVTASTSANITKLTVGAGGMTANNVDATTANITNKLTSVNAEIKNLAVTGSITAPNAKHGTVEFTKELKVGEHMNVKPSSTGATMIMTNGMIQVGGDIQMASATGVLSAKTVSASDMLQIKDASLNAATLKDINDLFNGFSMGDSNKGGIYKSIATVATALGVTAQGSTDKLTQLKTGLNVALNEVSGKYTSGDVSGQVKTNNISDNTINNTAFAGAAEIMKLFNVLNTRINDHFTNLSAIQLANNKTLIPLINGAVNSKWIDVSAGLVASVKSNSDKLNKLTSDMSTNKANISAADISINLNVTNIAQDISNLVANYKNNDSFDASWNALKTKVDNDVNAHGVLSKLVNDINLAHVPKLALEKEIKNLALADTYLHSKIEQRLTTDLSGIAALTSKLAALETTLNKLQSTATSTTSNHAQLSASLVSYNAKLKLVEEALGAEFTEQLKIFNTAEGGPVSKTVVDQLKSVKGVLIKINNELKTKLGTSIWSGIVDSELAQNNVASQ